ncbi:hypothetical protein RUM43_012840 [Polyplax serrata]|uniref:Uncharacterized protein n=1 Tax=Polyplax serrata TaxID=468196 RepID=A0AAN8P1C0_POLSC
MSDFLSTVELKPRDGVYSKYNSAGRRRLMAAKTCEENYKKLQMVRIELVEKVKNRNKSEMQKEQKNYTTLSICRNKKKEREKYEMKKHRDNKENEKLKGHVRTTKRENLAGTGVEELRSTPAF